jgi:NADH-quinone oxidoreductase subunit G/NADP-reducing hydrogenase subunit HndD
MSSSEANVAKCTVFCPTSAIKEVDHTIRVMQALSDQQMVVVLQTAPAVRVTVSEMFGGASGECSNGRLVGAAKAAGFRFVFDTNLAVSSTKQDRAEIHHEGPIPGWLHSQKEDEWHLFHG